MRAMVVFLVVFGLLTCPRLAVSDDGGPTADAGESEAASGECADGGACENDAANASPAPVVACDGDLCDTLQGRPSCSLAGGSVAHGSFEAEWVAGAFLVALTLVARGRRRGA
jgi:hypothetical protein